MMEKEFLYNWSLTLYSFRAKKFQHFDISKHQDYFNKNKGIIQNYNNEIWVHINTFIKENKVPKWIEPTNKKQDIDYFLDQKYFNIFINRAYQRTLSKIHKKKLDRVLKHFLELGNFLNHSTNIAISFQTPFDNIINELNSNYQKDFGMKLDSFYLQKSFSDSLSDYLSEVDNPYKKKDDKGCYSYTNAQQGQMALSKIIDTFLDYFNYNNVLDQTFRTNFINNYSQKIYNASRSLTPVTTPNIKP